MDGAMDALAQRARAGTLARLGIMGAPSASPGHLACAEEALGLLASMRCCSCPRAVPPKQDRPVTPRQEVAAGHGGRRLVAGNPPSP